MIFVSVGTISLPFNRLTDAISQLVVLLHDEEFIIQHGNTASFINSCLGKKNVSIYPFLRDDKVSEYMKKSRITIIQAGEGSFIRSLESCSSPPIIVPRHPKYGEHVDNQQLLLAEMLLRESRALVAMNPSSIIGLVKKYDFISKHISWKRRSMIINNNLVFLLKSLIV